MDCNEVELKFNKLGRPTEVCAGCKRIRRNKGFKQWYQENKDTDRYREIKLKEKNKYLRSEKRLNRYANQTADMVASREAEIEDILRYE